MPTPADDEHEDPGPFESWYPQAWSKLVAAVALDVGDLHQAEDSVAAAMGSALARWGDGSIRHPSAWVYQVAVRDARRARSRRMTSELTVGSEPSCDIDADPDLWAAVADLPTQQRRAVVLKYLFDLTQGRVAEVLGVAPGTAAALLHQARASLRTTKGVQR